MLEGAEVPNSGSVDFQDSPGGTGTRVQVRFRYRPPMGKLGSAVFKLFGPGPSRQVRDDLQHLKSLMEEGEGSTPEKN